MANWAIGVDLGGTKIEIGNVDDTGKVIDRVRMPTDVAGGPSAIEEQIHRGISKLCEKGYGNPMGVGVGVAAQIDAEQGVIRNAPNLKWKDVPFQENLKILTKLPVTITNDVRAAALGEWLYGSGKGSTDMICMFVGTGIGGGIVCNNQMLLGCSNTAGEIGHMIIRGHGLPCHCGSSGCLESIAGGWAIGKRTQQAIQSDKAVGAPILKMADGDLEQVTAKIVVQAFNQGDLLAKHIVEETLVALVDSCSGLVNAFNPCRLILGGGVIEGLPSLVEGIETGVRKKALPTATQKLAFFRAALGNDAGVVGAAALAMDYCSPSS